MVRPRALNGPVARHLSRLLSRICPLFSHLFVRASARSVFPNCLVPLPNLQDSHIHSPVEVCKPWRMLMKGKSKRVRWMPQGHHICKRLHGAVTRTSSSSVILPRRISLLFRRLSFRVSHSAGMGSLVSAIQLHPQVSGRASYQVDRPKPSEVASNLHWTLWNGDQQVAYTCWCHS